MNSFFPSKSNRSVPGHGKLNSRIAIVGDYTSPFDDRELKPFSGPVESVLEQCLHGARLIKGEVYMTNTLKSKSLMKPTKKEGVAPDLFNESKGTFTSAGLAHVDRLRSELDSSEACVIVACGAAAFAATCGITKGLSKYRGYVFPSRGLAKVRKVIPTHHPSAAMRGMYTYRHMILADLQKAKIESTSYELVRPERQLVYDYASVEEALQWLAYFETQEEVSFDIEVINYETACISFSSNPNLGCVIPIGNTDFRPQGWTEDEEALIWRGIQRILGNPNIAKVGQNLMFDIQFLLARNNIVVRGEIRDTMMAHSVMYPELPKNLGFLGSLYCGSQAYWKDTVKFNNIKEES